MKAPSFEYVRARDAAHAVELLGSAAGTARPIAGGQSLGPMLNLRVIQPELLVDVRRCPDLRAVVEEDDGLVYGAAITHAEIEDGAVADPTGGWLAHAARQIAYRAVRNRGTIGGSLAHADPSADWPCVLLAIGAEAIIMGPSGSRALAVSEFLRGPFATALAPDEILTGIRIHRRGSAARYGYHKITVKSGEFATAMAVVVCDPQRSGTRAVVGAIERTPLVVDGLESLPTDLGATEDLIAERLPGLSRTARRLHAATLLRAATQTDGGETHR